VHPTLAASLDAACDAAARDNDGIAAWREIRRQPAGRVQRVRVATRSPRNQSPYRSPFKGRCQGLHELQRVDHADVDGGRALGTVQRVAELRRQRAAGRQDMN